MPYNNIINRTKTQALVPEDVANDVWTKVTNESAVLSSFRRIPVGTNQLRIPVLSALPTAYWVTGDTGLKQTTEISWANKFLNIEELAVIVPMPQNVLDDVQYDIWGEARPLVEEAVGRAIDSAVFFGTNAPASFPQNINAAAAAAGNTVTEGSAAASGGWFNDFDLLLDTFEADGYDLTGVVAARSARGKMRRARNTQGDRIDAGSRVTADLTSIDGEPIRYPMRGLFPAGGAAGTNIRLFAGQWDQFAIGVRKDMTWELADQAVIQDNTGAIIYNLFQQDMVAMRVTMRVGWQVANIINYDQPTEASRYPVGILVY